MNTETRIIEIPWKTIFKVVVVILAVIALYFIREVLAVLFLAIIISSVVSPTSEKLMSKLKIPRLLSVILIYLFAILFFLGLVYIIVPSLIGEIKFFIDNMPAIISRLSGLTQDLLGIPISDIFQIPGNFQELVFKAGDIFGRTLAGFARTVTTFAGTAASAISVVALSFYLSVQPGSFEGILKSLFVPKQYEYISDLQTRVQKKIGRWLGGQLVLGIIIGTMVYIGLAILGIPYALILAVVAAIFELVPVAGPIIAAVPSIIVALLQDPVLGLATLILYMIVQQLENHFIVPMVMKRAVGLNPVLILLSLLIGFNLAGIIGMILSVPAAVTIIEILTDIQHKEILNHEVEH